MEAEGERERTQCANSRMVIAESSLTCTCEGAQKANKGRQEQQLNFHCVKKNSSPLFSPVKTHRDVPRGTTPEM